jgi:hypothetical protein
MSEFAVLRGGLGEGMDLVGGEFFGVVGCEGDQMGNGVGVWWDGGIDVRGVYGYGMA